MQIKELLAPENIDEIDTLDEKWRKWIEILDCNSQLYGLRTENFKISLQRVIEEIEKDKLIKAKSK